jgi:diguanylate cyclase (GGDEF)-like protein
MDTVTIATDISERKFAEAELSRLANTDSLTGLSNRRQFFELGETQLQHARKEGSDLALLLCDVDHFKSINDRHGHAVGDIVLRALSELARRCTRAIDCVSRIGGEEFAVLLPGTGREVAMAIAERIRVSTSEQRVSIGDGDVAVTVSIGVATLSEDARTLRELLAQADAALYRAKDAGRNRVVAN